MAMDAVGLGGLACSDGFAAHQVFSGRHGFKVFWVHAGPVATQVIDLQPRGQGTDDLLVHPAVRCRTSKDRVPAAQDAALPLPASILGHGYAVHDQGWHAHMDARAKKKW